MFYESDIVIRRKSLFMAIDLKFQCRRLCSVFLPFVFFSSILADHKIKYHIRRNDPHIRFVESLVFRCIDTDLKIHPFPEIFRIPAAFRVPAGITSHRDLITNRSLIIFFFIRHTAADRIFICSRRAVIMDADRVSAPGHLIQICTHHRFCNIFILGGIQPAHISPGRSIVPDTLRFDLCNIADKLLSEHKFCIQCPRSVGKRQYLEWHCRIF